MGGKTTTTRARPCHHNLMPPPPPTPTTQAPPPQKCLNEGFVYLYLSTSHKATADPGILNISRNGVPFADVSTPHNFFWEDDRANHKIACQADGSYVHDRAGSTDRVCHKWELGKQFS
jgi:hypothetical protein